MKKLALGFLTVIWIFCIGLNSCSSEKKADTADSAGVRTYTPTVPDTTRSTTTHMDTSQKPPR